MTISSRFHLLCFVPCFIMLLLSSIMLSAEEAKAPLKVGVILGLSGPFTAPAMEMRRGIELASAEEAGYPVSLVFEDDQGMEQKPALTALTKLAEVDKVAAVLNWVNTTMLTLAPAANKYRLPLIEFWDHNHGMLNLGSYIFCSGTSTEQSSERSAEFAFRRRAVERVAVVTLNDPWSRVVSNSFIARFKALGGRVVYEAEIQYSDLDLRSIIMRAKSKGAQAFAISLFGASAHAFIRQARELNFSSDIYTADGFLESDARELGRIAEGVYSMQILVDDASFRRKFTARFPGSPSGVALGYAALAYDGLMIVRTAAAAIAARGEPVDREHLRKEFSGMRYAGVSGAAVLSGNAEKVERAVVVRNGAFEPAE